MMTTRCAKCKFDNPDGMRFCGNCGARLVPGSADASARPPAPEELGVLMGSDLAERLQRAGIEATGQRRNVIVLFADLCGYTSLGGQVDVEDLYDLIQQYISLLMNAVFRYEGMVDKLTGDGLMALFGAPIAHENNAELAVRAALDMQNDVKTLSQQMKEQLGGEIQMRVGLHAGSVIVGSIGSDMLMNYTAIGDTVNLARRIEEAAPEGATLISDAVYRQVQGAFDCTQITLLHPKGIAHPVLAYRVLGQKTIPGGLRGFHVLRAPMIGRSAELNQLQISLAGMLTERRERFVLITGEAGLGKSRLSSEFKALLPVKTMRLVEGHSLPYRRYISYWLIQNTLLNFLGASPGQADLIDLRERLVQAVHKSMGAAALDALPYLEHLLALTISDGNAAERIKFLDSGQLRRKIFLAVRNLLLGEIRHQPILLILEDLHWADEASLELLQYLLSAFSGEPVFILAISRVIPEGPLARTVEWARQNLEDRCTVMELQHLSNSESSRLLVELLDKPVFPENIRQLILQRAAGIPFYLEEILRMLIDQEAIRYDQGHWEVVPGSEAIFNHVPESLQGLILARFDRLDNQQRRLLQIAAVIGKTFSLQILSYVSGDVKEDHIYEKLWQLTERDFIESLPGGDGLFSFRHILMSDAIYATLLKRDLRQLHGKVGEAIETLYADNLDSQVELLANHFRYSAQPDRALHYLILAGEKAARNNLNTAARGHYEAALGLLAGQAQLTYRAYQVHLGLGDALFFDGDYPGARSHFRSALDAIKGKTQPIQPVSPYIVERGLLERKIARTYERQSEYEQALRYLGTAQVTLESASQPEPEALAQVWNDLAWIHYRRGDSSEAERLLRAALQLVQGSQAYEVIASILNRLGGVAYSQGKWNDAAEYLRQSITIRQEMDDGVGLAASFNNLGFLEIEMGQLDRALEDLTHSYELKMQLGQPEGIAAALNNLGWLRIQRGELEEAHQDFDQAEVLLRQIGYTSLLWQTRKNIGEMHLMAGEWEQAQRVLSDVVRHVEEGRALDQLLDVYRLLGESALQGDDLPSAVGWDQKAHETLVRMGKKSAQLSVVTRGELARFRGLLAIRLGDWETARGHLEDSQRVFEGLESPLYQGRITFSLGAWYEAQGARQQAQAHYQQASQLFTRSGARLEARRAADAEQRTL